ncbi:hypothetical protein OC834_006063 [Tilletia horrida]|nr:hypothetical protein OC834_006063 [Tilletia horrida]
MISKSARLGLLVRQTAVLAAAAPATLTAAAPVWPPCQLVSRQGALAGINDVLSDAGKNALDKAQHRTAGLSTTQLSVLIAVLLLVLGLGCFGLWYCVGARAQRRHARQAAAAAPSAAEEERDTGSGDKSHAGKEQSGWTRFNNESQVTSSTSLNKF